MSKSGSRERETNGTCWISTPERTFVEVVVFFADGRHFEEVAHDVARVLKLLGHVHSSGRTVVHDDGVRFTDSQTSVSSQRGNSHQLRVDSIHGLLFQLANNESDQIRSIGSNTCIGWDIGRFCPLCLVNQTRTKNSTLHKTSDMAMRPSASVFPMRMRTPAREVMISSAT